MKIKPQYPRRIKFTGPEYVKGKKGLSHGLTPAGAGIVEIEDGDGKLHYMHTGWFEFVDTKSIWKLGL